VFSLGRIALCFSDHALTSCDIHIIDMWMFRRSSAGFQYVGVGYNLLTSDPDGEIVGQGGVDPGLRLTHRIIHTGVGDIPHDIAYEPRDSCAHSSTVNLFYGTKSYQNTLKTDISSSGM
jgi:hypothetical protein